MLFHLAIFVITVAVQWQLTPIAGSTREHLPVLRNWLLVRKLICEYQYTLPELVMTLNNDLMVT